jgi:hypothetical protein
LLNKFKQNGKKTRKYKKLFAKWNVGLGNRKWLKINLHELNEKLSIKTHLWYIYVILSKSRDLQK